jgi:uncharacterized OB-fold protein
LPYGIGLVALDAGPRLQAHLVDPEYPSAPQPDDRVSLGFAALLADAAPILTIRSVA